ncbi:hypothetical protein WK39_27815 [Burkholderia cepacia]|uniref:hypothetical protein n=1 Tax=Burkholderia cepacia complex TaxID=87882 RepID=UPI00075EC8DD|nr:MULTISPECIES: hypothetical protein [Burkholderia cepacia complex]KVS50672.1 hypothetical protein WK39_27815 [Burkholderia cepacia]KVS65698.1 hypothetical protein WK40_12125 [Burkholderia cepacia]KWO64659.1 hypothetical protein WT98_27020 [Burkholderia territorii]
MTTYLVTVATLFLIAALGNLFDLARGVTAAPMSPRVRALCVMLQGVLGAWALFLLLRGAP